MVLCGVLRLVKVGICGLMVASCATTLLRGKPKTAQDTYEVALEDLEDGLYPEAVAGFTELKTKYPYSKFAALADLRIADTHFERGKYVEAIDAYRAFLKYHPSHIEAAYAMFRIGESYYEQIPADWWFLPPSSEKDQASTRLAISAYRDLLARFPNLKKEEERTRLEKCQEIAGVPESEDRDKGDKANDECHNLIRRQELVDRGQARLDECRRKLADHEMYVARFYFKRERFKAAAVRVEQILSNYGGLGLDHEALWLAARSRIELGETDKARQALERLSKEFPNTSEAEDATELLNQLGGTPADTGDSHKETEIDDG
ncbi:outer membrane protein assembly factor BamD [Myxococcota bacterium]